MLSDHDDDINSFPNSHRVLSHYFSPAQFFTNSLEVPMNHVTVLPLGLELEVAEDQSVMAAAHQAGYIWPTECQGQASCGLCVSIIREGSQNCAPMLDEERETLERTMGMIDSSRRLACRLKVTGPVTLTKRGVRQSEEA
jgi:2Fe-2S ferredoxin